MSAVELDPRLVADTLGVSTLDLADFLREKAQELMIEASKIARNEPTWYSHEDAPQRYDDLDLLVVRTKRLMAGAFECSRAWDDDH